MCDSCLENEGCDEVKCERNVIVVCNTVHQVSTVHCKHELNLSGYLLLVTHNTQMYLFPPSPHNWPEAGATVVMSQRLWWPRLLQYTGRISDTLPNPSHHHSDTPHSLGPCVTWGHQQMSVSSLWWEEVRKRPLTAVKAGGGQDITRSMPSVWLCL